MCETAGGANLTPYMVQIAGAFAGAVFSFIAYLCVDAVRERKGRWKTFRRALSRLDYQCNEVYNASISWRRELREFVEKTKRQVAVFTLPREVELDDSIRGDLQQSAWVDEELKRELFKQETDMQRLNHDFANFAKGYESVRTAHWTSEKVTVEVFVRTCLTKGLLS